MLHDRHPDFAWKLTPNVCATCLGRILEHNDTGAFLCASCGAAGEACPGLRHPPICACGIRVGKRDAGVRCRPNPRPRPAMPFAVVVCEAA